MNDILAHLPADVARCVRDGILHITGDVLELTEAGARLIAEEAGWAWGEDDDGDTCFVHTGSYHTYCYLPLTWRDLVSVQGLAPLTRPLAGVLAA